MTRKRTLLLVFIHGFKGGDDTFGLFPEHLQQTLQKFLPNIGVKSVVYPRYETRGNLPAAVKCFREWYGDPLLRPLAYWILPSPLLPLMYTHLSSFNSLAILCMLLLFSLYAVDVCVCDDEPGSEWDYSSKGVISKNKMIRTNFLLQISHGFFFVTPTSCALLRPLRQGKCFQV
ncbi:hypothetical protein EYR41_009400 [Orbilia oligospora]|uniref:DUF676 domain-containing protein n=1 Tax=Orbilia oligospora TaxID=2813651 RepID=A0A8H2HNA3_ORBOL|nr:hypothetical protein EYR41_009400 [Orbilia oligospora]